MERIFDFFGRYRALTKAARHFLENHGRIRSYDKNDFYTFGNVSRSYWCVVLKGLVAFEIGDMNNDIHIERIAAENDYFSGNKHAFSRQADATSIHFLEKTTLFEIQNEHLQYAVSHLDDLQHLYQILKQQQLERLKHFLRLNKITRVHRISYLHRYFPELRGRLTIHQTCSLLGYSNSRQYYEAQRYYLRHDGKY